MRSYMDGNLEHQHVHGALDPTLLSTERGIWAVKWSFVGLMITAMLQVIIVIYTGSVALLADTIHNFGDASTAIPLWIAFRLARLNPSKRFPYGYGKVEDLAGATIVGLILFSAVVAGYESIDRILHPQPVRYVGAIAAAAIVGFLGNELVAVFRIRVGKEIHSAALIADGYHARADGFTSLAVFGSVIGVWLGFPLADPVIGLAITALILRVLWSATKTVFLRMLDGVDPGVLDQMRHALNHVEGVVGASEVRARWIGHWLHGEVNLAVAADLSIREAHTVGIEARHAILHHVPYLSNVIIHVDPEDSSGELFHRIDWHEHDHLEPHFHP
ncbi:MAG TPA: cation diffusion facilitator family transporter [Anaerolineales bacterium]